MYLIIVNIVKVIIGYVFHKKALSVYRWHPAHGFIDARVCFTP